MIVVIGLALTLCADADDDPLRRRTYSKRSGAGETYSPMRRRGCGRLPAKCVVEALSDAGCGTFNMIALVLIKLGLPNGKEKKTQKAYCRYFP